MKSPVHSRVTGLEVFIGERANHAAGAAFTGQGRWRTHMAIHSRQTQILWIQLAAIVMVAVLLVAGGAHLFSLISKMRLSPQDYMIAQRAYDGWSLFAIPIGLALILTIWHTYLVRTDRTAMLLSLVAVMCVVATQVIFWIYTYPMNVASQDWTVMPEGFEAARRQWEYSHAVAAVLELAALIAITLSALLSAGPSERASPSIRRHEAGDRERARTHV